MTDRLARRLITAERTPEPYRPAVTSSWDLVKGTMATQPRLQWHREYLWRELWTERQLLDLLCGRDPDAPAGSHDEAVRRAHEHGRAHEHADVAIRSGELAVEWTRDATVERVIEAVDPALAQAVRRAVMPLQIYGRGYFVRPLLAIQWATKTRDRFPAFPFTEGDLAAVVSKPGENPGAFDASPRLNAPTLDVVSITSTADVVVVHGDVADTVERRRQMLDAYTAATGERVKAKIYRAADVHKPEFYKWLHGTLSAASETTRRLERFLVAQKPPRTRSTGELA